MRVITPRPKLSAWQKWKRRTSKPLLIGVVAVMVLLLLANIVPLSIYRGRALPGSLLGTVPVGGQRLQTLDTQFANQKFLPQSIVLKQDKKTQRVALADLGVGVDWPRAKSRLAQHGLLPLFTMLGRERTPVPITINQTKLTATSASLESYFGEAASPEHIIFQNDSFVIVPAKGATTIHLAQLKANLASAVAQGNREVTLPLTQAPPAASAVALAPLHAALQKALQATITLSHGTKNKQLTKSQIGSLYDPDGQSMSVNHGRVVQLVEAVAKELGITVVNKETVAATIERALSRGESQTAALVATTDTVVRRYCTAVRGVGAETLPELTSKLAATYSDSRGWNSGGRVAFVQADSGCDYTVWLSASTSMTSFGGVCDAYYSCRSGNNVVINYDRWTGATEPWNTAGGSLQDYRVMVINHETGHWLGFGHATCPGKGQSAPVMMQQSISLGGCTFNPWPTAGEINTLKQRLQLN